MTNAPLTLLACAFVAASNAAMAQVTDDSGEGIIMGAWSNPADCNRASASRIKYRELLRRQKVLNGSCVAVEGYWQARALFENARDAQAQGSNFARHLRSNRIGIYARDDLMEAAPIRPQRYLVVGRVGECETQWPGAMMVMGYCHYTGGPILVVSEVLKVGRKKGS